MFVDASALTAILTNEHDARNLAARLAERKRRITSPLAVWEATLAVSRRLNIDLSQAEDQVERYLTLADIVVVPLAPETRTIALAAYARFGKSRHKAGLNFGDCFAYACARHASVPLLYKGDDFAETDIETG